MFLKEDIHRFISSTELFLSDIRGLRYTGLKKVNFFVGHPVVSSGPVWSRMVLYGPIRSCMFCVVLYGKKCPNQAGAELGQAEVQLS